MQSKRCCAEKALQLYRAAVHLRKISNIADHTGGTAISIYVPATINGFPIQMRTCNVNVEVTTTTSTAAAVTKITSAVGNVRTAAVVSNVRSLPVNAMYDRSTFVELAKQKVLRKKALQLYRAAVRHLRKI